MKFRTKIIGITFLGFVLSSEAITLGRIRGAALIGQPLDMVVEVQLEVGEKAANYCFESDVFHADTRQDASQVRITVEEPDKAQIAHVRIASAAVIDEPVVTIYLHTGCGQRTTRRYVLLADLPTEVLAPPAPLAQAAAEPVATAIDQQAPAKQHARKPLATKRDETQTGATSLGGIMPTEKAAAGLSSGQPRLKLVPVESRSEIIMLKRVATSDIAPKEDLPETKQLRELEANVKVLLALAAKNEASLLNLKARLQESETAQQVAAERYLSSLVIGFGALVLVGLTTGVLLFRRRHNAHADKNFNDAVDAPTLESPLPKHQPESLLNAAALPKKLEDLIASKKLRIPTLSNLLNKPKPSPDTNANTQKNADAQNELNFDNLLVSVPADETILKQQLPTQ